jgi:hypothetical protein
MFSHVGTVTNNRGQMTLTILPVNLIVMQEWTRSIKFTVISIRYEEDWERVSLRLHHSGEYDSLYH